MIISSERRRLLYMFDVQLPGAQADDLADLNAPVETEPH